MSIFGNIIKRVTPSFQKSSLPSTRELIEMESKIGGKLFGPVPEGRQREFFCLDEHTWVWHESFIDSVTGSSSSLTTRYEIQGDRIVKIQDGQPHRYASLGEARNLLEATQQYYTQVATQIYGKQTA